MRAIADTGFVVAFGNRSDRYHTWALELAERITEPLLTCEAVLAESIFHLGLSSAVLNMVRSGLLRVAFDAQRELDHLLQLSERYADRRPDFADLCLIRMSELFPDHLVITVDQSDFRVYRRNKRDVIPLLYPPPA